MDQPRDTNGALAQLLAESKHLACPRCRYELAGSPGPACPECGLSLQLELRRPSSAAWFVGALGLALAAGFPAVMLTALVIIREPWEYPMFVVTTVQLAVSIAALLGWVPLRRWSWRRRRRTRWLLAVLCWLFPAGFAITFGLMMRAMLAA